MWAPKKVSAIQATPKTLKMATMPALKTVVLGTSVVFTLQASMITAPATSISIWITRFMLSGFRSPLAFGKLGRRPSKAPITTTRAIVAKKIQVAQ